MHAGSEAFRRFLQRVQLALGGLGNGVAGAGFHPFHGFAHQPLAAAGHGLRRLHQRGDLLVEPARLRLVVLALLLLVGQELAGEHLQVLGGLALMRRQVAEGFQVGGLFHQSARPCDCCCWASCRCSACSC